MVHFSTALRVWGSLPCRRFEHPSGHGADPGDSLGSSIDGVLDELTKPAAKLELDVLPQLLPSICYIVYLLKT